MNVTRNLFGRREVLGVVAGGTVALAEIPGRSSAGQSEPCPDACTIPVPTSDDMKKLHRKQIRNAREALKDTQPTSEAGLRQSLEHRRRREVTTGEDNRLLDRLITGLFETKRKAVKGQIQLATQIEENIKDAGDNLSEVGIGIARVVQDSIDYVTSGDAWDDAEPVVEESVRIIAHDFRGAMDGASTGADFAALGGGVSIAIRRRFALVGGLGAGAATSIIAYSEPPECSSRTTEG